MTGMKEGAGEDPFAEESDPAERTDSTEEADTGEEIDAGGEINAGEETDAGEGIDAVEEPASRDGSGSQGRELIGRDDGGAVAQESEGERRGERDENDERGTSDSESEISGSESDQSGQALEIPYKLRRDSVQDGRNRVPLFLQRETKTEERDALRELEDRFDDDVSLTDLREALVVVGLGRLDEVEEQLEEWGYGMTFDV